MPRQRTSLLLDRRSIPGSTDRRVLVPLALLAMLLLAPVTFAEAPRVVDRTDDLDDAQQAAFANLDSAIAGAVGADGIPGMAAAFVRSGGVVWAKAYGHADLETQRPVTLETPFGIGSISKTFIGAALMTEVERGNVALDQPASEVLPFPLRNPRAPGPDGADTIEVRHIVTHTSGIRDHKKTYPESYADGDPDDDFGSWLASYLTPEGERFRQRGNFLASAPGAKQEYSNIGATVGALIVEHAAKKPYMKVVRERIFTPLGMKNTGFMIRDFPPDSIAVPYEREGGTLQPLALFGYPTYPDGQIRASALDLGRYLQMMLSEGRFEGRQVLAPASVERMLEATWPEGAHDESMGVYWVVGGNRSAQHSGGDPGILALAAFNRNRDIGFIMLLNTDDFRRHQKAIGDGLREAVRSFPAD